MCRGVVIATVSIFFIAAAVPGAAVGTARAQCQAHQVAKLTASSPFSQDQLGHAVSIDGDVAAIGARADSDSLHQGGAVYVFRYDGSSWVQEAQLFASDLESLDEFGAAVSISGDTIAVGAHFEDSAGKDAGAAYLFRFDGLGWHQVAKLTTSDLSEYDDFGWSIAVSDDVVVVGAPLEDAAGTNSGAAYVFRKPAGGWEDMTETARLVASDGEDSDEFGESVAIDGDVALVGAHFDRDGSGDSVGSAYVFRDTGSGWNEEGRLTASDAEFGDRLGRAVAIRGDLAVLGAWAEDENGNMAGAAYVYEKPGGGWTDMTETAKLTASDAAPGDHLGWAVALDGDTVVAGAPAHSWDGSGWGAAYVFERPAAGWADATETARYTASDAALEDEYGYAVAVSGNRVVAGSRWHDTGLNDKAGAAYVHGGLLDCQPNGVMDVCDLAAGTSADGNGNGIPDECEGGGGGSGSVEGTLAIEKTAGAEITLSWGISCIAGDDDFAVYEGSLGDFDSHTARFCTTDSERQKTFLSGPGDRYFLVAPRTGHQEGSLGRGSDGLERPEGLAACAPRAVSECP